METEPHTAYPPHPGQTAVEAAPAGSLTGSPSKPARAESGDEQPCTTTRGQLAAEPNATFVVPSSSSPFSSPISLPIPLPPRDAEEPDPVVTDRSASFAGAQDDPSHPFAAAFRDDEHRRQRSNSLPPPIEEPAAPPSARALGKRRAAAPVVPSATSATPAPKLPPLSQHQLLALHQLRLPRPTFNGLSRTSVAHSNTGATAQLSIPALQPPITRATLRELDLAEILRNPQLRHDIVFDPHLMFRPNFEGERGERKREAAERYWSAVAAEVERGCRCTAWGPSATTKGTNEILDCVCAAAGMASTALSVLLQGGKQRAGHGNDAKAPTLAAPPLAARLPSRIPPLVSELRIILLSLLPSPTVHPHTAGSAEQITAVLDTDLITQQVAHGVLDVGSLARFLGTTLKTHCAPMRDEAVDRMVLRVEEGQIAVGLRMCFELLELMKLDIANHQLRTLRPFLLETALDFELKNLYDVHERPSSTGLASFEHTTKWFFAAVERVGVDDVKLAICDGLLELAFNPHSIVPASLARIANRTKRDVTMLPAPTSLQVPETLHLDVARLQGFHADVTDLTVVCLLLLLYRQLCVGGRAPTEDEIIVVRQECWVLIASPAFIPAPPSSPTLTANDVVTAAVVAPGPGAGARKLENVDWRRGIHDAALQLVKRLPGRDESVMPTREQQDLVAGWLDANVRPTSELFGLVQHRLRSALVTIIEEERAVLTASDAALLGLDSPSVAATMTTGATTEMPGETPSGCVRRNAMVTSEMMATSSSSNGGANKKRRHDDDDEALDDSSIKKRLRSHSRAAEPAAAPTSTEPVPPSLACLVPLNTEVRALGRRMAKVVGIHMRVYTGWYSALLESGETPTLIVHSEPRESTTRRSRGA